MAYRVIYHQKTEAELDKLYADIAVEAGTRIAADFVEGVITFIEALGTFPERGTG
ncbi:type II toxin-antitoxin system RelE/ParE family toxin (plasmid) [Rhizobium sullae]|uniref:Type II toxin-antitoxin system RelE/ParE family toxin n=1 Tax=Rhizobium sullae TaxID=50338 RepID=A0ABY5XSC2_RHISU|nr:type II toxin-antitoxin system RelE/ParE family toxin [Rhizobium sullae]UWU17064.1 type II toxin-antitoxin system RelE/ParE family toxin [Rhizobium sullae]